MIATVGASSNEIYEAVLTLSRSIAGQHDLGSLLSGVAESLQRIVASDYVALILHDADLNCMRSYVLSASGAPDIPRGGHFPLEKDPAGWVWLNQQPLVISSFEGETRWPEFTERSRSGPSCRDTSAFDCGRKSPGGLSDSAVCRRSIPVRLNSHFWNVLPASLPLPSMGSWPNKN